MPNKQSLKCCWQFRINLDNGFWLEFSSACTEVGGWNETGSLNIKVSNKSEELLAEKYKKEQLNYRVDAVEALIFDGKGVFSECGLVLVGRLGELIIAAGVSPGSVSVKLPSKENEFEPEFDCEEYTRSSL